MDSSGLNSIAKLMWIPDSVCFPVRNPFSSDNTKVIDLIKWIESTPKHDKHSHKVN